MIQPARLMYQLNKKGLALAFVIIIMAVLTILVSVAFLMAKSSITSSDSNIKSREAYLSSKSGIEFIKSRLHETVQKAQNNLNNQVAIKNSEPEYVISFEDETLYGYGSLINGFILSKQITENSPAYKNARIAISYSITYQLNFIETDDTTGAGTYTLSIKVDATSLGKSPEAPLFMDIFDKGIPLTFKYETEVSANYTGDNSSSGDYIPDTDINGPGIPVTDEWPTEESTQGSGGKVMSGNSTFKYNGNYYYTVLYNTWVEVGSHPSDYPYIVLINPGPARDINGWNGYPQSNNKTLDDFNRWLHLRDGYEDIQRGDKVIYNEIYYILRDEPDTISWVNAPPSYPWFVIPNQN